MDKLGRAERGWIGRAGLAGQVQLVAVQHLHVVRRAARAEARHVQELRGLSIRLWPLGY